MNQQAYLPIASKSDIGKICAKVHKNFQKDDKCITISKELVEEYLRRNIKPILSYVMNFATSDSFFNVIYNDFMQTNWDLTSFDISTKGKNYAE